MTATATATAGLEGRSGSGGDDVYSRAMQMREGGQMDEGENVGAAKKETRAAVGHWVIT